MRRRNNIPSATSKGPRRGRPQPVTEVVDNNKLSYIQRVPAEILGYIFQHHVDQNQSAWSLTLVSELWKAVALSTPGLWAWIFAATFEIKSGEEKWTVHGISEAMNSLGYFQVCRDGDEMLSAIARSGNVPLTVRCIGSTLHRGVWGLMQPLFEPKTSSRIEWLEVLFARDSCSAEDLGQLFTAAQFPRLRLLRLHSGSDKTWARRLLSRIKVTAMVLDEACVEIKWIAPLVDASFWGRLRVLEDPSKSDQSLTLNIVVPQCARLISLVARWPQMSVNAHALVNIQSLDIACDPIHLSHLNLSNLQVLSLQDSSGLLIHFTSHTTLPKLTKLVLKSVDIGWLSHFNMPQLEDLSICTGKNPVPRSNGPPVLNVMPQNIATYFLNASLPSVLSLTLDSRCEEDHFITALHSVPFVRSVHFIRRGKLGKFGEVILNRLGEEGDDVICEKLEELTLGSKEFPLSFGKSRLVRRVLSCREVMGRPIRMLDINTQTGKGKPLKVACVE